MNSASKAASSLKNLFFGPKKTTEEVQEKKLRIKSLFLVNGQEIKLLESFSKMTGEPYWLVFKDGKQVFYSNDEKFAQKKVSELNRQVINN